MAGPPQPPRQDRPGGAQRRHLPPELLAHPGPGRPQPAYRPGRRAHERLPGDRRRPPADRLGLRPGQGRVRQLRRQRRPPVRLFRLRRRAPARPRGPERVQPAEAHQPLPRHERRRPDPGVRGHGRQPHHARGAPPELVPRRRLEVPDLAAPGRRLPDHVERRDPLFVRLLFPDPDLRVPLPEPRLPRRRDERHLRPVRQPGPGRPADDHVRDRAAAGLRRRLPAGRDGLLPRHRGLGERLVPHRRGAPGRQLPQLHQPRLLERARPDGRPQQALQRPLLVRRRLHVPACRGLQLGPQRRHHGAPRRRRAAPPGDPAQLGPAAHLQHLRLRRRKGLGHLPHRAPRLGLPLHAQPGPQPAGGGRAAGRAEQLGAPPHDGHGGPLRL